MSDQTIEVAPGAGLRPGEHQLSRLLELHTQGQISDNALFRDSDGQWSRLVPMLDTARHRITANPEAESAQAEPEQSNYVALAQLGALVCFIAGAIGAIGVAEKNGRDALMILWAGFSAGVFFGCLAAIIDFLFRIERKLKALLDK